MNVLLELLGRAVPTILIVVSKYVTNNTVNLSLKHSSMYFSSSAKPNTTSHSIRSPNSPSHGSMEPPAGQHTTIYVSGTRYPEY
jgi:hypothetical protein